MSGYEVEEKSRASTGALLKDLSSELTDLVHEEVQLAKAELAQKAKRTGAGASLLAVGAVAAALSAATAVAAAIAALSQVISVWLASLIAAAGLILLAGGVALVAKRQLVRGMPLAPEEAIEDTKEEVEWLRTQARSARR